MQTNFVRLLATASLGVRKAKPTFASLFPMRNLRTTGTTTTSSLTAATHVIISPQTSTQHQQQQQRSLFFSRRTFGTVSNRAFSRYSASTIMTSHCTEFRFDDYDIIGFDLDGTLLRYNLNEVVPLEYNLLRRFLVEQKGYPRALLDDKSLDRDFLQKGLIIDAEHGNVLKLSASATILRATHGTRLLTTAEIVAQYGEERQWDVSLQFFANPLSTWNGPLAIKLRTLLDYFDVAVSLVFAQTIDVLDAAEPERQGAAYKVWPDILEGLVHMYTRENFINEKSGYFQALRADPDRYLLRTSANVVQWLRDLRAAGKATFLLTGSNIDYANFTATYALGADWQELFDCVVCFARKPGFFTEQRPFLRVDGLAEVSGSEHSLSEALSLNNGASFTQGNWKQLQAALAHKLGKTSLTTRSLYVGDNLIQDVYSPVKHHDLDSVAISEELLANGDSGGEYEFRDVVGSSFWGSYFCLENEPTLWSSIIAQYAQLCVPLMDTVVEVDTEKPVTYRFLCENADGYFPKAPAGLVP